MFDTVTISWRQCEIIALLVLALLWSSAAFSYSATDAEVTRQPLVAALHVHSTMSTGSWTLEEVVRQAEALSLDAVVLTENFALRYEYGLFPLRGAFRVHTQFPSVIEYGIKDFLQEVEEVQTRHPKMVLVPGVEVAPYYHWTGSLWKDNLTMHDAQKNLLVFGLVDVDDYTALPVLGNTNSYEYGLQSAVNCSPVFLFIPAIWLWRRNQHQRQGLATPSSIQWPKIFAVTLTGIALSLLFNAWPLSQPRFTPYRDDSANDPYQALIDTVAQQHGASIWSLTEARDFSQHPVNPLGTVTIKTDPHPEMLLQTKNYTGFGGVYQDTRTVTDPGGIWDQTLQQYLTGERDQPPFTYGEIAFHTQGQAGIELDQVLTVFWVQERTTAGVIEALRSGHAYAVGQYQNTFGLRLKTFHVNCGAETPWVASGETLVSSRNCEPTVHVSVAATDHQAHPVLVRIIRSGSVVAREEGTTPMEFRFTDTQAPREQPMYYRMDIQESGEVMSNPIFVTALSGA
ncbi:MAG: hypothetical protein NPIRA05_00590 [Nitrospirales bacterium]|nr:MAG: hypothetical protein NPIRA05_00590 [Nitrospirales bacterium]